MRNGRAYVSNRIGAGVAICVENPNVDIFDPEGFDPAGQLTLVAFQIPRVGRTNLRMSGLDRLGLNGRNTSQRMANVVDNLQFPGKTLKKPMQVQNIARRQGQHVLAAKQCGFEVRACCRCSQIIDGAVDERPDVFRTAIGDQSGNDAGRKLRDMRQYACAPRYKMDTGRVQGFSARLEAVLNGSRSGLVGADVAIQNVKHHGPPSRSVSAASVACVSVFSASRAAVAPDAAEPARSRLGPHRSEFRSGRFHALPVWGAEG